jgi:anti-sigma regulatory factor (Ser/Thr protein kinase)
VDGDAEQIRHTVPAVPDSVGRLRRAAVAFAAGHGAPAQLQGDIALAVSEAATNVVLHAYRAADEPGDLHLEGRAAEGAIRISIRDEGCGMEPRVSSPGLGLGLPLIAQLSDGLEVTTDDGTEVAMRFALGREAGPTGPLN